MQKEIARPEYPRPQFVRKEWENLNGEWEFAFDDGDLGIQQGWHDGRRFEGRITVPFAYQHPLSGINDKGIHEVVWYARTIEAPASARDRDLLLHFGAVDFQTFVWVNGQEVGHNRGGHVPFTFDIAPYLRDGENRLTVRAADRQDPKQPRGKQSSSGLPQGIDYYCTTGIWQTVWLEPAPPVRIENVRVNPQYIDDAIHLLVFLHAPSTEWILDVEVLDGEVVVARQEQFTSSATAGLSIPIPNAKLWSPDSPHLYTIRVRLRKEGQTLDEIETYAGLRRVELKNGRFVLNGEPLYLAMVLDQGYFPGGYLTAESDDALRQDVEWIKRFGFNGARKHQKIEDPRWLYWCDKLGLLVWGEMPNARAWSLEAEEWLAAEWERAVERDYNHPCVVTWVPINESMGFPELKQEHPGQYAFLERIVAATRQIDPDRPVIDNDGWEHTDIGDILAVHDYSHSGDALRERYARTTESWERREKRSGGEEESARDEGVASEVWLPERIWTGSRAIFARGSKYRGQPIMLTEVGGLLYRPDVPADELDKLYKVYASFKTAEELLAKYEDIMEGIADLPFVAGFCYTQLTDIEQEINGLLTFDRRPKIDPETVAAIHRRLFSRASS